MQQRKIESIELQPPRDVKLGKIDIEALGQQQEDFHSQENLYRKIKEKEEFDLTAKMLRPYASFLVRYPSVIVFITFVIVTLSLILGFVKAAGAKDLPDFSNPTKGVEARGTMLSSRDVALHNLNAFKNMNGSIPGKRMAFGIGVVPSTTSNFTYNIGYYVESFILVYEHESKENLFDHMNMKSVCLWYKHEVETLLYYKKYVSFVHHIPNYISWLNNRTDCEFITQSDVGNFVVLLQDCVGYYKSETFLKCIENITHCNRISDICKVNKYVKNPQDVASILYNTFHYLGDISLINNPSVLRITASASVLKTFDKSLNEDLFKPLYTKALKDLKVFDNIKPVAYEMWGFKFHIFNIQILVQSGLAASAILLVIILTGFYSGSFFLGLMTFSCIVMALVIAYFVYGRVLDLDFFPFININTLIFIVGIGADDVFVYTRVWSEAKRIYKIQGIHDHVEYMTKWTTHSLRHAVVAMLTTSLSTAAAFFANMTNSVTVGKSFGLFAGTSIIVNYLLIVSLFPATVVLHDRYFSKCMHSCCPGRCQSLPVILESDNRNESQDKCSHLLTKFSDTVGNTYLPKCISKFKYIFITLLLLIGIGATVVTYVEPGLQPPTENGFQMFLKSNSLEQYDLYYKKKFAFVVAGGNYNHVIQFVFGVSAVDNGNKYEPDDRGSLVLQPALDMATAQIWLRKFCQNIRNASFYVDSVSCSRIEDKFQILTGPCIPKQDCCGETLPLPKEKFMKCFISVTNQTQGTKSILQPLFIKGKLRTLVISVITKYHYSYDYKYNKGVVDYLEDWTQNQMKNAPDTFRGWWHGNFQYYDIQRSLYKGTTYSLGIAVGVAFVVILLTSMNVILTLYSIVTIVFIISVTVGTLVLRGWTLNIVESTVFSLAAGLSVDFTLHYSEAYRTSLYKDLRMRRVQYAISHIGSPIVMGATTTFVGGMVMIPSTVLCYVQFGEFLMLVMFFSWVYSTFFFLPLCAAIGPTGHVGELTCRKNKTEQMDFKERISEVIENKNAMSIS